MATVGSLNVRLGVLATAFESGLAGAGRKLQSFSGTLTGHLGAVGSTLGKFDGSIMSLAHNVPLLGSAFSLLASSGLVAFVKHSMDAVVETGRMAEKFQTTTEFLLALQRNAKLAGLSAEDVGVGLTHLQRELGQVAAGSKEAAAKLGRLGFDAQALANMPLGQAFGVVSDRFKELVSPAEQAGLAMAVFGKQGNAMIPVLAQGSEALDKTAASMAAAGTSFSNLDFKQVEAAELAVGKLNGTFKAVGTQLAVQLAPYIEAIAVKLQQWSATGVNIKATVGGAIDYITQGIAFASNTLDLFKVGWNLVKVGVISVLDVIESAIEKIFETAAKLPAALGGDKFAALAQNAADMRAGFAAMKAEALASAETAARGFGQTGAVVETFFEEVKTKAEGGFAPMGAALDYLKGKFATWTAPLRTSLADMAELFDSIERGAKLVESSVSPLDEFAKKSNDLVNAFKATRITSEQFGEGINKAFSAVEKAGGAGETKHPQALLAGSSAAISAALKYQDTAGKSPQERVEKALTMQMQIQQQQLSVQRDLVKALEDRKVFQL